MAPRHSLRLQPQIHDSQDDARMARRRSPRLHPQILGNGEGTGVTRRRSPSLNPQIQAREEGAGVTGRRSSRLHPQVHPGEEGAGVASRIRRRRRKGTSPDAADASLPDNDDMLREILLRLPPQPSSLPRAAPVCKRWRGLVTDPRFRRQFCEHHRKPPLLGFFSHSDRGIVLTSVLDPPNHIPPQHFGLGRYRGDYHLLDCRHGLLLLMNESGTKVVVCDPITSKRHRLAVPRELTTNILNGAVLCAATDHGHIHGSCHSSPFKVVVWSTDTRDTGHVACVYSSETGVWGDLILTGADRGIIGKPAVLVGNCLYWLSVLSIVEFNLDEHSIAEIEKPPNTFDVESANSQIIRAEDGVLAFLSLSYHHFQMWRRNGNGHGVGTWVHWKTIAMCTIIGIVSSIEGLLGYNEDTNAVFTHVDGTVYMVELKSMQSRKLHKTRYRTMGCYYPFTSFYTPAVAGGSTGAEIFHNA